MAPRKKHSSELIAVQARAGRIRARQREEHPLEPPPKPKRSPRVLAVDEFVRATARSHDTFKQRVVSGQVLAREYGAEFNWRENHLLCCARSFAEEVTHDDKWEGPLARRFATRFLTDLKSCDFVLDPEGLSLDLFRDAFLDPKQFILAADCFYLANFFCWKKKDGDRRFNDTGLSYLGHYTQPAIQAILALPADLQY